MSYNIPHILPKPNTKNPKPYLHQAFTLLELAISITIIALLVAAVTAGQNIKHRLALNQVVDDISNFNSASSQFVTTYAGLAGDLYNAESLLGEANVGNETVDGNGDGNGDGDSTLETNLTSPTRDETLLYWQHLAVAGFITGSFDASTTGNGGMYEGQFKNVYYQPNTDSSQDDDLYFLVSRVTSSTVGRGAFTTKEAFDYDSKYDDSDPETGTVRAVDGNEQTQYDCVTSGGEYNLSNTEDNACALKFYVE